MVGSAICRQLALRDDVELIVRSRKELDLTRQEAVEHFFANEAIDEVYLAAAKVGGIHANNSYPAEFIYENLVMQCNIIQWRTSGWGPEVIIFGVLLYLSQAGRAAND